MSSSVMNTDTKITNKILVTEHNIVFKQYMLKFQTHRTLCRGTGNAFPLRPAQHCRSGSSGEESECPRGKGESPSSFADITIIFPGKI